MQSFLVDALCFLGGDRSQPLAQGNQPPIALDDPFTVIRGAGSEKVSLIDFDGNLRSDVLAGLSRNVPPQGPYEPPLES